MIKLKNFILTVLFSIIFLYYAGCSDRNKKSIINPTTGEHAENWISDHRAAFLSNKNNCAECHGADRNGGISNVSCFSADFNRTSCHADGPFEHTAEWLTAHGSAAKSAPGKLKGFSNCQSCHGEDFSGGNINKSCFTCHSVNAPHSKAPWRSDTSATHTNTDINNANICVYCHSNGANSVLKPNPSAPEGTQPGCFNNTLCHSNKEHSTGWDLAEKHGETAIKDFPACSSCHGSDYKGGISGVSCYKCHQGPGLNHSTASWIVPDHKNNALSSLTMCQKCHGIDYSGGGAKVACNICHMETQAKVHIVAWYPDVQLNHRVYAKANGTTKCANVNCHGASLTGVTGSGPSCSSCHIWPYVRHPSDWKLAAEHGIIAELDFSACQACHGTDFRGGTANISCFNCHTGPGVNHPAAAWIIPNHKTNAVANISQCQKCHGTNYLGGGSKVACNICHMENQTKVHMAAWYPDVQLNHRAYTKTNGTVKCANVNCHGANLTGIAGSGPSCSSCHAWPFTGTHPSNWNLPANHGITAEVDFSACQTCHGTDFKGGTSGISCFNCHNGPGVNHPAAAWIIPNHKTNAVANITSCQKCHGTNYLGGGSKVACNICHMENQTKVHMTAWYPDVRFNHSSYAKTNGTTKCANINCHGASLTGVTGSGPSCLSCHIWPLTISNCVTCHATPPSGSAYPNIAGSHAVHTAFINVNCSSCHTGAGANTNKHINNTTDVIFNNVYKAKSGNLAYNGLNVTCAKVSCHGGQTTPNWLNGSININTQCNLCHISGTTEFNSYSSGRHSFHISAGITCVECHDINKLPVNHFTNLDTSPMTGANLTIITNANYTGGKCTINCHSKNHSNLTW
ncbi:MAG: CxxxxCH/CxxCH domain-containing protein [bacterium]|nr:CxxxxCH/CxxCH domain-containing protein [bacterium]